MRFKEVREVSIEEIRKHKERERKTNEALGILRMLADDAWDQALGERNNCIDPDKLIEPAI